MRKRWNWMIWSNDVKTILQNKRSCYAEGGYQLSLLCSEAGTKGGSWQGRRDGHCSEEGRLRLGDACSSYRRFETWNEVSEWTWKISCPEILGNTLIRVGTALQEGLLRWLVALGMRVGGLLEVKGYIVLSVQSLGLGHLTPRAAITGWGVSGITAPISPLPITDEAHQQWHFHLYVYFLLASRTSSYSVHPPCFYQPNRPEYTLLSNL